MPHLLICASCHESEAVLQSALERLRRGLEARGLNDRITLRSGACMGACEDPVSIGLHGAGLATYVFSGVKPDSDLEDILASVALYLDSPRGWIEDARPCGRLRFCLRARLQAFDDQEI